MKEYVDDIGLVLLAAGASKRLGKPKQLLRFRGETLLKRAVKLATASERRSVIVVLGANAEKLKREISEFKVEIVENPIWENGMGTSIQIGVKSLLEKSPDAAAVILMTCDQPFVSAALLDELAGNFRLSGKSIIASSYGATVGIPALFSRALFPELLALKADSGAKKIIFENLNDTVKIPFEQGATDIDTEADFLNLIKYE